MSAAELLLLLLSLLVLTGTSLTPALTSATTAAPALTGAPTSASSPESRDFFVSDGDGADANTAGVADDNCSGDGGGDGCGRHAH